jgi:hypothetical protein
MKVLIDGESAKSAYPPQLGTCSQIKEFFFEQVFAYQFPTPLLGR